jgi:uncharacterized protein (DUF1800 family)
MGDENTVLSDPEARHLLRRTGFGVNPNLFAQITKNGETRGEAADRLLDFTPTGFKPKGSYIDLAHNKWVKYMTRTSRELQEKLVLFWHDHFATNYNVVGDVKLMGNQNRLFRQHCKGNFKEMVKAVNTDAAMMEFLDTVRNRKYQPNENYARELEELFTLGVTDWSPAQEPNYDQEDIVQIARAFTGWRYDDKGVAYFDGNRHDYMQQWPERGPKVIFKNRGGFGNPSGQDFTVNGEGEAEISTVIDIIFQHRDSEGKNTVARYIARRLFTFFAYADPDISVIDEIVAASMFDTQFDVSKLLRALFVHDAFYETMQAPSSAGAKKSVKWPVDYVVSTLRALRMKLKSKYQYVDGGSYEDVRDQLTNMGQVLLEPPSVFGWEWETAWISSATLLARYGFARDLCSARGGGGGGFHPERLFDLTVTDPGDIVDMVTDLLGVTDQFIADERQKLIDYLTDNTGNPVDLQDYDTRNRKLNGLVALVLQSPAYQLH